jgi:hypothetical protein
VEKKRRKPLPRSGGRVPKKKLATPHRNWPRYVKNSLDHTAAINGYPIMVLPKTYGVHAFKTTVGLVSEAGKMIMLDQAQDMAAKLPYGTDVYLVIGDPRHEYAVTQSNRIGSMRSGTDRVDLRMYVNDFRGGGNWIDRMQRFHGIVGDILPDKIVSMYDIGRGAWDFLSLQDAEAHFLSQGFDAVEIRRVCPEYTSEKTTSNLQMLRRYKRRTAYPIESVAKKTDPVGWISTICSFVDPTPTGGKVVPTFRFACGEALALDKKSTIRLLVHNIDASSNDAPVFRYFWHGLTDDPVCKGSRIIHDGVFGTQTLIR